MPTNVKLRSRRKMTWLRGEEGDTNINNNPCYKPVSIGAV